MRIFFTGASSFTGAWFARALARAGHEVTCTFTRVSGEAYQGLRRQRVEWVLAQPGIHPLWETFFGSKKMLSAFEINAGFDVLCHHGAEVGDYKSPLFDWRSAFANNTEGLENVLRQFRSQNGRTVVVTGSYFESDEGAGDRPTENFSPYALSKVLTWQAFRHECGRIGLSLGKYVLPNPLGPMEDPRFPAYLVSSWLRNEIPIVTTPAYLRDSVPVPVLAEDYATFIMEMITVSTGWVRRNPSGWIETVGELAHRISCMARLRISVDCPVSLASQSDFFEPKSRYNTQNILLAANKFDENEFWNDFIDYLCNKDKK